MPGGVPCAASTIETWARERSPGVRRGAGASNHIRIASGLPPIEVSGVNPGGSIPHFSSENPFRTVSSPILLQHQSTHQVHTVAYTLRTTFPALSFRPVKLASQPARPVAPSYRQTPGEPKC